MLRLPLIAALAVCAVAGTLAYARDLGEAGASEPLDDIAWSYRPAADAQSRPLLELKRAGMTSMFDPNDLPDVMRELAAVPPDQGAATGFRLVREAGTLVCTGRATGAGHAAAGTCRFDPDQRFLAALAERGLSPEDNEDMLALALVDARLASVDGLSRAGYRLADADDLMAVSALDVSPAFAVELRGAGLVAKDIEDLVTARALEIDAAWVQGMAEAGYPNLGMEQAIQFRALDVTPDYARRMTRVMRGMEGTE
ncbi:MAG TPA: hypothetical protein VI168_19520 [Croceibacterium sp.]